MPQQAAWMNLHNVMLSEEVGRQRPHSVRFRLYETAGICKRRDRKQTGCLGLGGGGVTTDEDRASFQVDENVLKLL